MLFLDWKRYMEHEHLVETLLSTASDIVHKAKIENEE
jgi:hypothetical protein